MGMEAELVTTVDDNVAFLRPGNTKFKSINEESKNGISPISDLKSCLLSSLQMQHVAVLAGCGTSLGNVKGPSMQDLWDVCTHSTSDKSDSKNAKTVTAVKKRVKFDETLGNNIEALLSRCEAYLDLYPHDKSVDKFIKESKRAILGKCSEFLNEPDKSQLEGHRTFLQRLARRRVRDPRLKIFTTNYDLCFERVAGELGLVVVDGFSYSQPRNFDPRYFTYDIVRRNRIGDENSYLEGVFQLYKLHGSVNWERQNNNISVKSAPKPENACLIYPANGKYQKTYIQPHLELMSQFLAALREPNTCLIVAGFGFNDNHLAEPILAAVQTNPHFRLIVVDFKAKKLGGDMESNVDTELDEEVAPSEDGNPYWQRLKHLSANGEDVWIINASFQDFAKLIPDLRSLTPAQKLAVDLKEVVSA